MFAFDKPYADLKVLGLVADMAACGYYRLEYPLDYLRQGGAMADTATGVDMKLLNEYDIILAQRQYQPELYGMLQEARRFGKVVIYEVDDYLHGVHPHSPAFRTFRPGSENLHWVDQYLKTTDALFVSTPELAGEYSGIAQRTWVLPNGLDFGIRDWETRAPRDPRLQGRVVVGWAGSSFHPDDNLPLLHVLGEVFRRHPEAVFAICSGPAQVQQFLAPLQLPSEQVVVLDPVPFHDYPRLLSQFDVGLAPLANTRFNRSKSELKLLEYGALGIPYVASRVAPYNRLHLATEGAGGYLCTSEHDWRTAISALIEDAADRKQRGEFMQAVTREHYSLAKSAYLWAGCLRQARDQARYAPESERKYQAVPRKPGRNDSCPCGSGVKYKKCCSPAFG